MQSRGIVPVLIVAGIAGCAGNRPAPAPDIGYLPPAGPPASARSALVRQSPFLVFGNIVDRLQQEGLQVTELDEEAGQIAVHYQGDPEAFVNCGWLVRYESEEPLEPIRASSEQTRLVGTLDGERMIFNRELDLDARMQVRVRPDAEGALVITDATYTLTKILRSQEPDGSWTQRHEETVVFNTGESATFSEGGTVCQPTGELERLVLGSLPATSVVGAGGA